jgi:plastocyanin
MKFVMIIAIAFVLLIPISAFADPHTIETANDSGLNLECAADCYTPNTLTVDVGHTITMTNADESGIHTFTSGTVYGFTPIPAGEFDSGILMQGESFEFISNMPDVYPYYCTLHVWMQGTIIVQEAAAEEEIYELELIPEPTPELIPEPTPELIPELIPEPISEPIPELIPEPTPEPIPELAEPKSPQESEKSSNDEPIVISDEEKSDNNQIIWVFVIISFIIMGFVILKKKVQHQKVD